LRKRFVLKIVTVLDYGFHDYAIMYFRSWLTNDFEELAAYFGIEVREAVVISWTRLVATSGEFTML
jgi:hypothetical protein